MFTIGDIMNSIQFECQHCQTKLEVSNGETGKHSVCPVCKKKIIVPTEPSTDTNKLSSIETAEIIVENHDGSEKYLVDCIQLSCTCIDYYKNRFGRPVNDPIKLCKHLVYAMQQQNFIHPKLTVYSQLIQNALAQDCGISLGTFITTSQLQTEGDELDIYIPENNSLIYINDNNTLYCYHKQEKTWSPEPQYANEWENVINHDNFPKNVMNSQTKANMQEWIEPLPDAKIANVCTNCQKKFLLREKYAFGIFPCPYCNKELRISRPNVGSYAAPFTSQISLAINLGITPKPELGRSALQELIKDAWATENSCHDALKDRCLELIKKTNIQQIDENLDVTQNYINQYLQSLRKNLPISDTEHDKQIYAINKLTNDFGELVITLQKHLDKYNSKILT